MIKILKENIERDYSEIPEKLEIVSKEVAISNSDGDELMTLRLNKWGGSFNCSNLDIDNFISYIDKYFE